jgi:hypothetical protein
VPCIDSGVPPAKYKGAKRKGGRKLFSRDRQHDLELETFEGAYASS